MLCVIGTTLGLVLLTLPYLVDGPTSINGSPHPSPTTYGSSGLEDFQSQVRGTHSLSSGNRVYGVVFDAGSTGSRVHVFELSPQQSASGNSYELTNELFQQVKPGLSSYADNPIQAAESLDPLLHAAERWIPKGTCRNTTVVLRATAGLRLLNANRAENILSAVRQKLTSSCLVKLGNAVSILDGHLEGLYLWISLNFMTDRMPSPSRTGSENVVNPHALDRTVGTLDLGGGSTQITFAPSDLDSLVDAPEGFAAAIDNGEPVPNGQRKLGKHVYSYSYLGLGLMSARYSMLHTVNKRLSTAQSNLNGRFFTACIPPNISIPWSHAGVDWVIGYLPLATMQNTVLHSELAQAIQLLELNTDVNSLLPVCYAHALQVLRDPVDGNSAAPVYTPHGFVVHRPVGIIDREFYAFSYIFDLAMDVGLITDQTIGGKVSVRQFRDAADRMCNKPNPARPFECMDLCFITALLRDGYGFPWDKQITLQKKVKSFEISWGLGAMFAELSVHRRQNT